MSICLSKEQSAIISDLFKTMKEASVSTCPGNLAKHWLETCGCITGFVDGKWMTFTSSKEETVDIEIAKGLSATVKWASSDELVAAVKNSQEGFKRWRQYEASAKSKVLYRVSDYIEQQSKLLNAIDSLTKYGRLREKYNVPYLIDSFNYYAALVSDKNLSEEWKPTGVVCIICDNDTLMSSLWVLSAVLASGNAAICLVDCKENLSAFLLAQLCDSAGLPAGAFNVISCQVSSLSNFPNVDKIILPEPKLQTFISGSLSRNIPCEIIPHRWPCVIMYESADLDAATSNILEILQIFDAKEPWPVCKIYLQESIQKKFIKLLTLKVCGSFGYHIDCRPPFYIMSSEATVEQVQNLLLEYKAEELFNVTKCNITEGDQCVPAVVMNFNSSLKDQNTQYGPGIYIEQFRTVKESIAMFNQNKKHSNVSIWSEEMFLSLEAASKLKSRTVWINCQNIFTPSVSNGSLYLSGNSNIGGKEGIFSHVLCSEKDKMGSENIDFNKIQSYGSEVPSSSIIPLKNNDDKKNQKCYKLFIGGSFVNSYEETFLQAFDDVNDEPYAYVASANKTDIDKAVSSAVSSQLKWECTYKITRAAIFRKASEILNKKKEEFVSELYTITGKTKEFCSLEVEQAVTVLLYWANHITQFEGRIVETKLYGKVFQEYNPLGVIGIQCPDKEPLLSFIFLITPAIIFGNSVVAIASEKFPASALKMCEVFQASGLPGGVLNVVSSLRPYLTRHLSSHLNIDAMWFTEDGADFIYDSYHSIQPKKIFNCKNIANSLDKTKASKFLLESTYSKAIFIPMGTGFT